jgi:hypothetical protein
MGRGYGGGRGGGERGQSPFCGHVRSANLNTCGTLTPCPSPLRSASAVAKDWAQREALEGVRLAMESLSAFIRNFGSAGGGQGRLWTRTSCLSVGGLPLAVPETLRECGAQPCCHVGVLLHAGGLPKGPPLPVERRVARCVALAVRARVLVGTCVSVRAYVCACVCECRAGCAGPHGRAH